MRHLSNDRDSADLPHACATSSAGLLQAALRPGRKRLFRFTPMIVREECSCPEQAPPREW
jgi:hypothetical protein